MEQSPVGKSKPQEKQTKITKKRRAVHVLSSPKRLTGLMGLEFFGKSFP
jgi:hypothetical protein